MVHQYKLGGYNIVLDISSGSISVDDTNIQDITLNSLREHIGIVPQETALFNGTVYENILYGRLDATREEVEAAAKAANAHNFIMELPNGYETHLGDRGVNISGGQKQRVSIARAILKNPSILILDEATSSVDTRTEMHIQKAMVELMKGRTSLIIAHRLSTIRDADMIVVIKDGRVYESGNHEELLALGGEYAALYNNQFAGIAT